MQTGGWRARPLVTAPCVMALDIGARTALFCSRTQRLSALNETAALAWRALAEAGSFRAVVERLQAAGASADESEAFSAAIVGEWLKLGYVAPCHGRGEAAPPPIASLHAAMGPVVAELQFFGDADAAAARTVFGHLASRDAASMRIDILGLDEDDIIFVDGQSEGLAARNQTVPRLKALLTRRYCAAVEDGFLAHAALVSLRGKRVLLSGQPGAGKTTLTLALCASGFAYGGDDIVHVGQDGRVEGAPFAAAVKPGAWPLLAPYWPALAHAQTHLRSDGQSVRYVAPERLDGAGPRRLDVVLLLDRRAGKASLQPIEPSEALCALLDSGYAESGGVDGDTLEAMSRDLSAAVCARLSYDRVESGSALVEQLLHE